jgi:2-C-methyl-D-erythritol 2,4-cyclodiphosphate synthase
VFRIGLGIDIHRFEGLLGHSDADCVLHALCDGLLGACALGDLGQHFPSNEENKDRSSVDILKEVCLKVWNKGFKVVNVDVVIMTEEPKLSPHRESMVSVIAPILNIEKNCVGIKATTCEGLGAVGRKEGLMAQAVVLLEKKNI